MSNLNEISECDPIVYAYLHGHMSADDAIFALSRSCAELNSRLIEFSRLCTCKPILSHERKDQSEKE